MRTGNLQLLSKDNLHFRNVVETGKFFQMVIMNLQPGEEIREEVHPTTDQLFLIMDGDCEVIVNGEGKEVEKDGYVFIPAGKKHTVINIGSGALKLVSLYAPPLHPADSFVTTKETEPITNDYTTDEYPTWAWWA